MDCKIIAFKVEFGEFLSEHKFFKFWSKRNKPNRFILDKDFNERNPLLEEFVDGIAFMLAIALESRWDLFIHGLEVVDYEVKTLSALSIDIFHNPLSSAGKWLDCLLDMLQFAFLVGLSVQEIEQAYYDKSNINLKRQVEGY